MAERTFYDQQVHQLRLRMEHQLRINYPEDEVRPEIIRDLAHMAVRMPLVHRSWMHDRTHGDHVQAVRERALAEAWEKANVPDEHDFSSTDVLRHLFLSTPTRIGGYEDGAPVVHLTQRDAVVAATVVQWLGTNVGFCFLEDALKVAGYDIVHRKAK